MYPVRNAPKVLQSKTFHWSFKHNYFVCLNKKAGSTNWMHWALQAHLPEAEFQELMSNGQFRHANLTYPQYGLHHGPGDFGFREAINNRTLFKFAVVRHPWPRFIGSFREKYFGECKQRRECMQRKYIPDLNTELSTQVTLDEVLLTLLHIKSKGGLIDKHFENTALECKMGTFPYDFVGELENPLHMDYILKRLHSPIPLPAESHAVKYKVDIKSFRLPCNRHTVDLAAQLYKLDLETYNFTLDEAYAACERDGFVGPPLSAEP